MIINKTKNKKIWDNEVKLCPSILSQMKGFMFSKPDKALVFIFKKEKIVNLHMFFILHPIDVLWLDKKKKVVKIKENFKPFRVVVADKPAKYIIEMPAGAVSKSKTKIGDTISFSELRS